MKGISTAGMLLLVVLWIWLARALIVHGGGFSPKNILLLVMTAIIIFVPIYKKYLKNSDK